MKTEENNMSKYSVQDIQKRILEIFKVVSDICERNNLRYFAIGGTCIGAVRHKGFIPWDDDLDIAMPENDFRRFIELAPKELPDYYELFIATKVKHQSLLFIKVMDTKTTMTENDFVHWKDSYEGVWVDIMPMSGVPGIGFKRNYFIKKCNWIRQLNLYTKNQYPRKAVAVHRFAWCVLYPLRFVLPQDYVWNKWQRYLSKHAFDSSEYVGYVWSASLYRLIFEKKWFSDFVYMDFEDTKIRCPVGWHEFLTQMFGNYMDYPPENQRNSGHEFSEGIVDLEHSYKDYQSGKLSLPR